jgi:hypothetical protein
MCPALAAMITRTLPLGSFLAVSRSTGSKAWVNAKVPCRVTQRQVAVSTSSQHWFFREGPLTKQICAELQFITVGRCAAFFREHDTAVRMTRALSSQPI